MPSARFESKLPTPASMRGMLAGASTGVALTLLLLLGICSWMVYTSFRVDVPSKHVAIMIKKTGLDLPNDQVVAPDERYKGVQLEPMKEGRAFFNPYFWDWKIVEQKEVPPGKCGVLIRQFGEELPHDELLARKETQKGIVPDVLKPGRYPQYSNEFAYKIQEADAVTIEAGYVGVVTLATGKKSKTSNRLLVENGEQGVQKKPYQPETYYVNPYEIKIAKVDCRTKKLDLSEEEDMGFPSKDGFWIRLDGYVQFHVIPERAPEVFVIYNEDFNGNEIAEEIVEKIIMPNARSFCRLAGSGYTGRQFIDGSAREKFQTEFQSKMVAACQPLGIHIEQASITNIYAPEPIAEQLKKREIAKQMMDQFQREMVQQKSAANLIKETMLVAQKKRIIDAGREVIQTKTKAQQDQLVAITKAEQEFAVATKKLEAAKDKAAAIVAKGKAAAEVIKLNNEASVSGLKASIAAYNGKGELFAQQVLFEKLAPAYRQIMANSADSPLIRIFEQFQTSNRPASSATSSTKPLADASTSTAKTQGVNQ